MFACFLGLKLKIRTKTFDITNKTSHSNWIITSTEQSTLTNTEAYINTGPDYARAWDASSHLGYSWLKHHLDSSSTSRCLSVATFQLQLCEGRLTDSKPECVH